MADEYPNLTFAEIKKLKVAELKARLSSLGLPTTGLKADLVARLASFLESTAIHARLKAEKDEQESNETVGDTSGGNIVWEPSIPKQIVQPSEPPRVFDVGEPVAVGIVAAEKVEVDTSEGINADVAEPPVESAGKDLGSNCDVDKQAEVQQDAMLVAKAVENESAVNEWIQPEEKEPEVQQDVRIIEEERGDEIRGSDTQADEVGIGVWVEPQADQISSNETESSLHEIKQTTEDEHPQVETRDIGPDVRVGSLEESKIDEEMETGEPQVINVDQVETKEDILPQVIEPEQLTEDDKHDKEMETETSLVSQGPAVSVEVDESEKDKQSESSNEEIVEPQHVFPSSHVPEQPPSDAPTYPPSESSFPHTSALPPPQAPAHQTSQIPFIPPSEVSSETVPTTMDKMSTPPTPPRDATHVQPPPRDASPREPTPQEETPTKGTTPPDPLAEAKARARSVVEMRERRLNEESQAGVRGDDSGYDVDHYEQEKITATESRQEKKKKKKKKRKKRTNEQPKIQSEAPADDEGIEVEYVQETLDYKDPVYAQFASIFETFKLSDKPEATKKDEAKEKSEDKITEATKDDDDEMDTDSDEEETQKKEVPSGEKVEKLSKKKLKLQNRMSVAQLKQTVHRPDVVEMHDVTAPDPKLLVYLKACRNTVPVPRHWCFKRKFLQGKRGIIKPPFQLPEFIQKTGIMEMREALQEKEDAKNMKAKMREKIRPKMGKIDIDYQKLHDAFFKWQTKPKMTIHGDLYYEGKEFETKLKEKKPGDLSEDLRTALGMPTGQGSNLVPPPWLIAMQRYGPPPSYPNLKIRGLNAPIPEGASFGYHAGGWGKPPVDEHGRPLYGDVFGVQQTDVNIVDDELVDSNLWGELESESEESEESEEESEEEAADQSGLVTPAETGLVTPSGLTSIPAGMETPDMIELRKRKNIEDAMESGSEQPSLYTVLPEKRAGVGGMMMGTAHVYDLATASAPSGTRKTPGGLSEGVEVALDPSELELDPAAMQARYDEQLREQQNTQKEDFSDMVAEHAARQQKKRKKTTESGKAAKKYKEFKF